jgi:hypothetical protein
MVGLQAGYESSANLGWGLPGVTSKTLKRRDLKTLLSDYTAPQEPRAMVLHLIESLGRKIQDSIGPAHLTPEPVSVYRHKLREQWAGMSLTVFQMVFAFPGRSFAQLSSYRFCFGELEEHADYGLLLQAKEILDVDCGNEGAIGQDFEVGIGCNHFCVSRHRPLKEGVGSLSSWTTRARSFLLGVSSGNFCSRVPSFRMASPKRLAS